MLTRFFLALVSLLLLLSYPPFATGQFGGDAFSAGDSPGHCKKRQEGITIYSQETDPPEIHWRHARSPYTPDYGVFIPYPQSKPKTRWMVRPAPSDGPGWLAPQPGYTNPSDWEVQPGQPVGPIRPPSGWPVQRQPSQIPDPLHHDEALPEPVVDLLPPMLVAPGMVGGWRSSLGAARAAQFTTGTVQAKVRGYLFNPRNADGWDKGQWFVKALGYNPESIEHCAMLERQISFDPARAVFQKTTSYGQIFEQLMQIAGPNGRTIGGVRAIWQRDTGTGLLRLVTVIPPK